jgi:predicted RNase H-like nuclease (RuvC/YqgF family)
MSVLASAATVGQGVPLDTVIIGAISSLLGIIALINSSKAKQEHAAVEGHAANIKAFDQAERFYKDTHEQMAQQSRQLGDENKRLTQTNLALARQLDRFERLVAELNIALPDDWPPRE